MASNAYDVSQTCEGDAASATVEGVLRLDATQTKPAVAVELVAREEPLEIRLAGLQVAVTMRTPGNDFDLIAGFLVTEGILESLGEIEGMSYCPNEGAEGASNIVNVRLKDPASLDPSRWQRNFYASSSCGVCGKASIDSVRRLVPRLASESKVPVQLLYGLQSELQQRQPVFRATGGIHAAGIATSDGVFHVVREDIGRHNAVDKSIGALLLSGFNGITDSILLVSGRASFEVVQKAAMARIPVVAAVSAPSSLAVELAEEAGITLVAFLRLERCNVYTHGSRIMTNSA